MNNVMASASEAERESIFNSTKEAVSLRTTLHKMGYPQPLTPAEVNNSTAVILAKKKSSNRSPSPWTCGIIGYKIMWLKNIFNSIGDLAIPI